METELNHFTVADYDNDGAVIEVTEVAIDQLDEMQVEWFEKKLARLSGDLELPLEGQLPGDIPHIDFRIGSDFNGAYVLYYLHDEVVFASLYLRGEDDLTETELTQVFKFLLLDSGDADEPSEDEIESVLASAAFDFPAVENRPVVYAVHFSNDPEEETECQHIKRMDQHLAAAFFAPRENLG
jgi:hypothetical protein